MDARDAIVRIQAHNRIQQQKEPDIFYIQKEPGTFYLTEALDMAVEALEKQIPRKPIPCSRNSTWTKCPVCDSTDIDEYCGKCGQRLDWENEDG